MDESDADFFIIPRFRTVEFFVTVLTSMDPWPVKEPSAGTTAVADLVFLICFCCKCEKVIILFDCDCRFVVLGSGLRLTFELKLTVCPFKFFTVDFFLVVFRFPFGGGCIAIGANASWYGT